MSLEIVKVNDIDIECPFENEQHFVAVRSVCQALKIDHQKQYDRIKNDPILGDVYTDTVYASDSTGLRKQAMFCLPIKYVFGWLFSIDESKVNPKAKTAFLNFKRECYEVLYDHFSQKGLLYERREKLISNKERDLDDQKKAKSVISENIRRLKSEIIEIRQAPIGQLSLFN
ncbi:MAG: hypothetical protein IPO86_10085 [Saprospiraceae bacterium]|nr:hypothetical protein [Saprospiraceae bacterium]